MKRPTLAERIPAALELSPNTTANLAILLASDLHAVWTVLAQLQESGAVRKIGTERTRGRPRIRWAIAA